MCGAGRGASSRVASPKGELFVVPKTPRAGPLQGPSSGKETVNYDVVIHCELSPPTDAYGSALTGQGALLYI